MSSPQNRTYDVLLPKTSWFLLLLIPLVFLGFYPSYFSKIFTPLPSIFHVHTFFMVLWIVLALIQPVLISQKKIALHKRLGKASYVIMPLVVITIYLMIRHSYYSELERLASDPIREKYNLTHEEIYLYAAAREIKALVAFIWLITFYVLAMYYRKVVVAHATFMLASILVLLGPALDRILFSALDRFHLPSSGPAEYATFTLVFLILLSLLIYQKKRNYSVKAVSIALAIHIAGMHAYAWLQGTKPWQSFVEAIM